MYNQSVVPSLTQLTKNTDSSLSNSALKRLKLDSGLDRAIPETVKGLKEVLRRLMDDIAQSEDVQNFEVWMNAFCLRLDCLVRHGTLRMYKKDRPWPSHDRTKVMRTSFLFELNNGERNHFGIVWERPDDSITTIYIADELFVRVE